jgi:hypothetical protein
MLARALVLVAHLPAALALLILATLLLPTALAGLLLILLLLSGLRLVTGLATLLLSHCYLQVAAGAAARFTAAIAVPRADVWVMTSDRHTGSRCPTRVVPRFTTHASFLHRPSFSVRDKRSRTVSPPCFS